MIVTLREMNLADYPQVNDLWQRTENIGLSSADSQQNLDKFLKRNLGLNYVIFEDQQLVGTILGGHDGRRGAIYHLAVDNNFRGKGYGKQLLDACVGAFSKVGIERCHIHVYADNAAGIKFWQNNGWFLRPELTLLSKDIKGKVDVTR
jgi:ribosomal protein S18 acetylase RimI-like enzyme